jgi:hypothetical protein
LIASLIGLAACSDSATDPKRADNAPGDDESVDMPPSAVDTPEDTTGHSDDTPPATELLVRRAALLSVETKPPEHIDVLPASLQQCADGRALTGLLDKHSPTWFDFGRSGMFFDAYVVTARRSGTTSIFSSVSPNGDTYELGYGFPFTVQAIDPSAPLPALSMDLVHGMPLPDNALDDGKARVDLQVEADKQYVVVFKNLFGDRTYETSSLNYTLTLCGSDLQVEGKLWIAEDETDLIPAESLTGAISLDNASPGAMGQLASTIAPGDH